MVSLFRLPQLSYFANVWGLPTPDIIEIGRCRIDLAFPLRGRLS